jgi:hypothetical protein
MRVVFIGTHYEVLVWACIADAGHHYDSTAPKAFELGLGG